MYYSLSGMALWSCANCKKPPACLLAGLAVRPLFSTYEFRVFKMYGKKIVILFISVLGISLQPLRAQDQTYTAETYIAKYRDIAIREMQLTGIPASITLAQGLLESGVGNSALARNARNHFGIKCKSNWTGATYYMTDDEENECFRAYGTDEESYLDHSYFLVVNQRYDFLFDLHPKDYAAWAAGLKKAGYATNPKYPELLTGVITKYNLAQYDTGNAQVAREQRIAGVKAASANLALMNVKPGTVDNSYKAAEARDKQAEEVIEAQIASAEEDLPTITIFNGIKATVSTGNETYESLADKMGMMRFELRMYNDAGKRQEIPRGALVYLRGKRTKAIASTHIVAPGETMYYISQLEGIKLKRLYKYNRMKRGQEPAVGEVLNMRFKRNLAPRLSAEASPAKPKQVIIKTNKADKPEIKQPIAYTATSTRPDEPRALPEPEGEPEQAPRLLYDSSITFHTVVAGDNAFSVAAQYGISLRNLQDWNNMSNLDVAPGAVLRVRKPDAPAEKKNIKADVPPKKSGGEEPKKQPAAPGKTENRAAQEDEKKPAANINKDEKRPAKEEAKKPDTPAAGADAHEVQQGETLYSISRKYGISVADLRQWNGLSEADAIRPGQVLYTSYHTPGNATPQLPEYHIVQAGEGLYAIARRYGLKVAELKALNKLETDVLSKGQKLRLR